MTQDAWLALGALVAKVIVQLLKRVLPISGRITQATVLLLSALWCVLVIPDAQQALAAIPVVFAGAIAINEVLRKNP